MYSHGNARNDHSVLHYGFLDRSRWDHPRVCCSDLDGADLWNCGVFDRDFQEVGAYDDQDRGWAMRRSNAQRGVDATNSKKQARGVMRRTATFFHFECSASPLTPVLALHKTGPAERDALKERYTTKLAAFSTSAREDEAILSGKRRAF